MCGREDQVVPRLRVFLPPEILHDPADDRSFRVPKDKPRTDLVRHAEQVELPAQLAVVPFLDLLEDPQVLVELLFRREGDSVDPREHLVLRIATPVRPGGVHQVERAHPSRTRHVGTPAQVEEVSHPV